MVVAVIVTVVMAVVAVRPMHMGGCHSGDGDGGAGRWRCSGRAVVFVRVAVITVVMAMPVRTAVAGISAAFGLERVLRLLHDQVHGAQHVG